jgi:hypothetical protein
MRGFDYFNLVLVTNVAGDVKSMDVKTNSSADWIPMAHNWVPHWRTSRANRSPSGSPSQMDRLVFPNIFPSGWTFGMTVASNLQFK